MPASHAIPTPKTRRVLAFNPAFVPGYKLGGPIVSMVQILDSLPPSVKVTLVTADRDLGDSVPYPGLSGRVVQRGQHEVYYLNWQNPLHWMRLLRWAQRHQIDLLYINGLWHPVFTILPVVAHYLGLLPSSGMLITPRGELSAGSLGIKSRKKQVFLLGWAPLLRRIDPKWQAATEMEQTDIHRLFPWARTLVQIDNTGDEPRTEIVRSSERARFVFISRIMKTKNLLLTLEALRNITTEIDFDIYGPLEDIRYWRQCERLIETLPRNVQARYLGELKHDEVKDAFAKYDGFILPTRGESFGNVILESLSSGCPVICSQKTPWTQVLVQGGGAALEQLDIGALSEVIEAWAIRTPIQRDAAKRNALSAFAKWRGQQGQTTALGRTLDSEIGRAQTEGAANSRRIALVTQGYQSAGGVQTVAHWLATGLRNSGYEIQIFDLATSRADGYSRRMMSPRSWRRSTLLVPDSTNVQLTHVGANAVEFEPLRYVPRAKLSTELSRFDLVQVIAGAPAPTLAAARCRRPIVLQVATTVAWERVSQLTATPGALVLWRRAMTKIVSLMENSALRRADAVLVENAQMHSFVRSVSQRHVIIAPPGVDTMCFAPPAEKWNPSGFLLSVNRLDDARKGLDRLIRSYALMTAQRASVPSLVLAGRGDLPESLQELIADLGLTARVSIRRDVPQSELPSLYQGASVYLQASHEEGLGISILEAMASGLPVVSTETAGTLETVAHGVTGWLVGQGSDVEATIASRTLSVLDFGGHQMSVAARSRADSLFSDQVTMARFLAVYDQLIGSGGGLGRN